MDPILYNTPFDELVGYYSVGHRYKKNIKTLEIKQTLNIIIFFNFFVLLRVDNHLKNFFLDGRIYIWW